MRLAYQVMAIASFSFHATGGMMRGGSSMRRRKTGA